jgi:phosphoglycolate phosphatase-like HAD superfamily hydrolase
MVKAVIFDIDGTLSDSKWRGPLARAKKWDEFFSKMPEDKPIDQVVELLTNYHIDEYKIILVTGRGEEHRQKTVDWLEKYGILHMVEALYMRPAKDFRRDTEIKTEIYNNHLKDSYKIRAVYEDRSSVVAMWRGLGLFCLQVDEGNF